MRKNKKMRIIYIVMVTLFAVTFSIGIFNNPSFNIYDFCMNLSSEILGMVIALVIVESYVREKLRFREDKENSLTPRE